MLHKLNNSTKFYILSVVLLAFNCLVVSVKDYHFDKAKIFGFILFCFLTVIADMSTIKLPKVGDVSVTFAIHLAAVINFGPLVPISSEIVSTLIRFLKRDKSEKFKEIFNGSQITIALYLGSMFVTPWVENEIVVDLGHFFSAFLVSFTYFFINSLLVTIVISLDQRLNPLSIWLTNFKLLTPHYLTLAPLGFVLAAIYYYMGYIGLILFFIPLLLARHSFKMYTEMRENYLNTIETLIKSIEAKDKYTKGHSERVANYSVAIGKQMNLNEIDLEQLNYLALLHDIGKVGVSDTILNKNQKLTDEEFDMVKHHPQIGAEIVKDIKLLKDDQGVVLHHHERWDGLGYPEGFKGELIPLQARIIAVADSFDAMTSDRAYRRALSLEVAVNEIVACSEKQFDPKVVEAFIKSMLDIYPDEDLSFLSTKRFFGFFKPVA